MATNTQKSKGEKTPEEREANLAELLLIEASGSLIAGNSDRLGNNLSD
jgi:hypothetical protein